MPTTEKATPALVKVRDIVRDFGVTHRNLRSAIDRQQVRAVRVGAVLYVRRSDVERLFRPVLADD